MYKNLTQYEIPRLPEIYNLTDGHVLRRWNEAELKIVDRVNEMFRACNRARVQQPLLEEEYVTTFLKLARQTHEPQRMKYVLCTSASMSLEIVANYLRSSRYSLALLEPCFDNLPDIFKRHEIALQAFSDEHLDDSTSFAAFLSSLTSSAICIVSPNNPTGRMLTEENFHKLIEHCRQLKRLLIIDASFRMYTPWEKVFDQYQLLNESGIDYIVIEDTGKTWPTLELKVSILAMSSNLFQCLYDIYTDFILHVSPFTLTLLREFIACSLEDNLSFVHSLIRKNRTTLYQAIVNQNILVPSELSHTPVAWMNIKGTNAKKFCQALEQKNVFVLPGTQFFWSDKMKGDHFIRISLMRDPEVITEASQRIKEVCDVFVR